jgi:phosphatidate cytidylyltransferase
LAALGFACVAWPPAFYALLLVFGSMMIYELSRLCDIKGQPLEWHVAVAAVWAYIALAIFHGMRYEGVLLAAIILVTFWLGMYGEEKAYFARTAYTLLGVLYIGKLMTYFVFIREVPALGVYWTALVIVLIAMTDIMGMAVGSLIGRHQLTVISPKKTIEGSLGSLLAVTAIGTAIAVFVPYVHIQWWQGAALAAATSVAAQAGDLVESALKRDAGVKDSGTVIQGHGGVLDRFDSYLFGGMAFFGTLHIVGLLHIG